MEAWRKGREKAERRQEEGRKLGREAKKLISSNSHTSRAYFLALWLEGQRSLGLVYFPSETQQRQSRYGSGFL